MAAGWRWRRAGLWAAVVLAAGWPSPSGPAFSGSGGKPPSLYQRTLAVAGQYRCPVCASESAAVSNAAEAVEMRSLIQGWLKQGDSQAQIRHFLVADYGTSILEKPPASGLNTLVWALPAAAGALGVAGLGFAFARWRRLSAREASPVMSGPVMSGPDGQSGPAGRSLSLAGVPPGFFGVFREFNVRSRPCPSTGPPLRPWCRARARGPSPAGPARSGASDVPPCCPHRRRRADRGGRRLMAGGPVIEPEGAREHRHRWYFRHRRGTPTGRLAGFEQPGRARWLCTTPS